MPGDAPRIPVVRAARPENAPGIARVWAPGWHDAHDSNVPAALTAGRTDASFVERAPGLVPFTTVAADGARVLGFVTVRDDEVDQLYVDPAARGTGLAVTLLDHAASAACAAGLDTLWLAVVPGNARARRFYERCGWVGAGALDHVVHVDGAAVHVPARRYVLTPRAR